MPWDMIQSAFTSESWATTQRPFDFRKGGKNMRWITRIGILLVLLSATVTANAIPVELSDFSPSAITIGWDTFPNSTPVPHLTPITNQYQSLGVLVSSQELGDPLAFSAPGDAFSDPNLLAPPGLFSGTIVIEFVDPATGLRSPSFTRLRAGTKIDPTTGGTKCHFGGLRF